MVLHGLKFLTKWGIRGVTIGQLTLICVSPMDDGYERTLNHEAIHRIQCKETGRFKMWAVYLKDKKKVKKLYPDDKGMYRRLIRFEQEAYENAGNLNYLKTRESFAWKQYEILPNLRITQ